MQTGIRFDRSTEATRAHFDRMAALYDLMQMFTQRTTVDNLRSQAWSRVASGRILEAGVGAGRNIERYPAGSHVSGIDVSAEMLERARRRAEALGRLVDLRQMDVQCLEYPDNTFDTAVATFVFCSVPDPIRGLRELGRVVRPGGNIWLLERVRVDRSFGGAVQDLMNPLAVFLTGTNINRQTIQNAKAAGLHVVSAEAVRGENVLLIHARPGEAGN